MTIDITHRLLLALTIISTVISCSQTDPEFDAEGDITKGEVKLISYGLVFPLPPDYTNYTRQVDSLEKLYGFENENRGCMTGSILLGKTKGYNKIVMAHLSKRNGDNWYQNYQRQVDSIYKTVDTQRETTK